VPPACPVVFQNVVNWRLQSISICSIFVLMLIHGSPISINFPQGFGDNERFWYWRGASGKKYIHSVYEVGTCPPLPGAIYVAVRRIGNLRTVIAVSRFPPFWDGTFSAHENVDADEIHVHLLARDTISADTILSDLKSAFEIEEATSSSNGFYNAADMVA
jgi:hypothetical protein